MKALLIDKWGGNYAGQVLTNVRAGSIPSDVAHFFEDDEPTPMDVVRDPHDTEAAPLTVTDDHINPEKARSVAKEQKAKVQAAKKAATEADDAAARVAENDAFTQRQAREADVLAAKRSKATRKGGAKKLSAKQRKAAEAGKAHTVK